MVVQMIGVGEQTGALDQMLNKIADFYEEEVDVAVAALTSLLEPMMMVLIGGMVGFMLIAMYLPDLRHRGQVSEGRSSGAPRWPRRRPRSLPPKSTTSCGVGCPG